MKKTISLIPLVVPVAVVVVVAVVAVVMFIALAATLSGCANLPEPGDSQDMSAGDILLEPQSTKFVPLAAKEDTETPNPVSELEMIQPEDALPYEVSPDGQWFDYVISDQVPTLTFEITKTDIQKMLEQGTKYTYRMSITCREKPDFISQVLLFDSFIDEICASSLSSEILFEDLDSDGFLDLGIEVSSGNANRQFQYYRWDDISAQYEQTPFCEITGVGHTIYPDTKQIITTSHDSAYSYSRDLLQLIDGKFIWLRGEEAELVEISIDSETDEPDEGDNAVDEGDAGEPKYILYIRDRRGIIHYETLTPDEYYEIGAKRNNILRFGIYEGFGAIDANDIFD